MSPIPIFKPRRRLDRSPLPAPVRRSRSEGKSAARAPSRTAAKKNVLSNPNLSSSRVPPADLTPVRPGFPPDQDAVIAVPPYFGQTHRYALYDAADIAGLNILAEVSDISAAALQWGIDKEFTTQGKWTIIYDMGSTSVGAGLVRYSTFEAKEAGKKKTHGQFEVKAVKWDESCGGEDMDMLLVDHFAAEFDAKHKPKVSVSDAPKAIAKLRKQVRKTKEILSANREAPLSVEGMHEDVDFRSTIKRTTFEELAAGVGLFDRAVAPLKAIIDLLPDYNITLKDVEVVEMIGGATRVPGIKAALTEALGGRQLDTHLDADEAVAMGAGLFAANMSTTFRMRKFGAADAAAYGFELDMNDPEHPGVRKPLISRYKRFPVRRVVSTPNATADQKLTVYHNVSAGPLPPGVVAEKLADFDITGVAEAMKKHDGAIGNLNVHFAVDNSGILFVDKAEYVVEVVDWVEVREKPPKKEKKTKKDEDAAKDEKTIPADPEEAAAKDEAADAAESDKTEPSEGGDKTEPSRRRLLSEEETEVPDAPLPDATETETVASSETADGEAVPAKEPKLRERRRVFREPLTVKETGRATAAMTVDDVKTSIAVLKDLAAKDETKRAQEAAKSNLEAYIYAIREKIHEDEDIERVTDETMRETFSAALTEAEDWLYMDGADSTAAEFDAKKNELKSTADEWIKRASEMTRRPKAVGRAREFVGLAEKTVAKLAETKPWIADEEKEKLLEAVKGFESWLDEKEEQQSKKSLTETPAFTAAEVVNEVKPLDAKLQKLKKTPAPKPPKENATEEGENTQEGEKAADGADAAKEETPAEGTEGDATENDAEASEDKEEKDHSELRR